MTTNAPGSTGPSTAASLHPGRARRASGLHRVLLAALAMAVATACSLLVEHETNQCKTDDDCAHFGTHPFCQQGVCVDSGLGPKGCFYGTPANDDQYLNQCTVGQCIPFDNCARLGVCDGGTLPPLTDPLKP